MPDTVPGCYRLQLFVYEGPSYSGSWNEDIRNFAVPEPLYGMIFPPYQMVPPKLPLPDTGLPNAKPDELNIGGQPFGWDGDGTDGLVLDFMRKVVSGIIGGGGGGAGFKYVPPLDRVEVPSNSLMLLEGHTVMDGYVKLNGHMRIIGRRRHPKVLPIVSQESEIPNNCIVPLDPTAGPFTLWLQPRGRPDESVVIVSQSDDPTPPPITVNGRGPRIGGQLTRLIDTPRESLSMVRRRGHSWEVVW
jgi:hypothetical protein